MWMNRTLGKLRAASSRQWVPKMLVLRKGKRPQCCGPHASRRQSAPRRQTALEQFTQNLSIGDVAANELVARIVRDIREALRVASVGQSIEIDDFDVAAGTEKKANEISADKPAPPVTRTFNYCPSFLKIEAANANQSQPVNASHLESVSLYRKRDATGPEQKSGQAELKSPERMASDLI